MKLIILNGPTGVGKSTVAANLHAQMPGSALLDIDEMRRTIPDYREKREESLRCAYELAEKAIRNNLSTGKDVIIDKTIGNADVIDSFIAVAHSCGAEAYEFLLFADKAVVRARADSRGYKPGGLLTPERVDAHWERADTLRKQRPGLIVVDTTTLSPDAVLQKVSREIAHRP